MSPSQVERRLSAIMAADVVGYSGLIEADELGTLTAMRDLRDTVWNPLLVEHRGRTVKLMGDGILAEFGSVVDAIACAAALQRKLAADQAGTHPDRRIVFRVGVNLGDVVVEGDDLLGDGVNIAARLEQLCAPGGVMISGTAYDHLQGKLDCGFEFVGEQRLKNIARLVRVYRMVSDPTARAHAQPLPEKPSIAVLPFANIGQEPEQESFADGLTEDLITDLSRRAGLFVIARHSAFAYKGCPVDGRQVARDLGVRYLLEGSTRRAAGRVRINVQLVDALNGEHLWAERFDRGLEDIFKVQDEVTGRIVEALVGRLVPAPARNRPASLDAYDLCVRGRALIGKTPEVAREASLLLQRAIALDPDYAEAHRWLAFNLWTGWAHWGEPMEPNRPKSVELAERAVALDPNDAGNRWVLGHVLAFERRWPESDAAYEAAFALDANQADAWAMQGEMGTFHGRPTEGIERVKRALRLNPHPPGWYYWELGYAQYAARQHEAAVETLRQPSTYRTGSRRILAASLAQLGKIEEARQEAELFMVSNPHFTIGYWAATQPFRDDAIREHFVDGYRKADLPA
ncbi:adenylate cyclase [Microvirga ossetica]|uniref:Adenylate cyclase n=1 Tax=Microvirga ossetica TaxID=1882682 RepID=A0A1B2EMP6_9HYPH|nr:adenylate/guanylate cyclase domain-containing protein [Microvirga ossetica]ANY81263.1 adenylate cyclase [Microvirga ossetica]